MAKGNFSMLHVGKHQQSTGHMIHIRLVSDT
jgi:hypothetical protein